MGCSAKNEIISKLLGKQQEKLIKEFALRLINAMASDYEGRSYLI